MKTFPKPTGAQVGQARALFAEEVGKLCSLDHPNIVRWLEACEDSQNFYIITEALTGGELLGFLSTRETITENLAARIVKQVLGALSYAHQRGLAHRSLKLCNVLLKEKPAGDNVLIKLTGFENSCSFSSMKLNSISPTCYYAPEVYQGRATEKSDIWSAGVLLFMVLCGDAPITSFKYASCLSKQKSWAIAFSQESWKTVSAEAKALVAAMLAWNPTARPSASDCLQHPWFRTNTFLNSLNSTAVRTSLTNLVTIHACSMLKEAVKNYILQRVCQSGDSTGLAETFKTLDSDGDGYISLKELQVGFRKIMPPDRADREAERVMSLSDRNGNGSIDYSEFLASSYNEKRLLCAENLRATFNTIDRNKEGRIPIDRLKGLFELNTSEERKRLWSELLKLARRSSKQEQIDFQEFTQLIQRATL